MRRVVGRMGKEAFPEVLDQPGQLGLIVLYCQLIIGSPRLDQFGNGCLRPHRVDGDRAASQRQGGEQLRNGRDFVGFDRRGLAKFSNDG